MFNLQKKIQAGSPEAKARGKKAAETRRGKGGWSPHQVKSTGSQLGQWHDGQTDPVYAVGSSMRAGDTSALNVGHIIDAIDSLKGKKAPQKLIEKLQRFKNAHFTPDDEEKHYRDVEADIEFRSRKSTGLRSEVKKSLGLD